MNKADRKQVDELKARIEAAKAVYDAELESIGSELRGMADAEQEKFDNATEGLQASEQGQAYEAAAEALGEAADACESGEGQEALDAIEGMS